MTPKNPKKHKRNPKAPLNKRKEYKLYEKNRGIMNNKIIYNNIKEFSYFDFVLDNFDSISIVLMSLIAFFLIIALLFS